MGGSLRREVKAIAELNPGGPRREVTLIVVDARVAVKRFAPEARA